MWYTKLMRDPQHYKNMHIRNETHENLLKLKAKTGQHMTDIVDALVLAALEGLYGTSCEGV